MKLVSFEIANLMRIRLAEGTLGQKDNLVLVTGKNGHGKTAVLKVVELALAGTRGAPAEPIHEGADKGHVVCRFDDGMTVRRTFTETGTYLKVTDESDVPVPNAQALLNKLRKNLGFNPLDFERQAPDEQVATLQALLGLDFTELDREAERIYANRTLLGRDLKAAQGAAAHCPMPEAELPEAEQSSADVVDEVKAAQEHNARIGSVESGIAGAQQSIALCDKNIEALRKQVEDLQKRIKHELGGRETFAAGVARMEAELLRLEPPVDVQPLMNRLTTLEATNRSIRQRDQAAAFAQRMVNLEKQIDAATNRLEVIEAEKAAAIGDAKLPVKGLSFDSTGVRFQGKPLDQCSTRERLCVSTAIALASRPELKLLLVERGNDLDDDGLAIMAKMADKAGATILLERIAGNGELPEIHLVDGVSTQTGGAQ